MRRALALLLLVGCTSAEAQDDPPTGPPDPDLEQGELMPRSFRAEPFQPAQGEFLRLEARTPDGSMRIVKDRDIISGTEVVVFLTAVDPTRDEYVYLLEGTGGPPRMIHPRMGRVHLSGELDGRRRIRPRPAHEVSTGDEEEPEGWQVAGGGWAEYRLVAIPSPRDEASAGSLGSFERFLEPPPYVTGRAAKKGRLVDSIIVRWE